MRARFSIITVCLNAEKTIKRTVESVLCQSFKEYEIIIKDGLSVDNTIQQIPDSDKIRVYCERDTGIYNAMNQAISHATSEYLIFLNAGDVLYDSEVLYNLNENIAMNNADVFYGDYYRSGIVIKQPAALTDFSLFRNPLNHQSMLFKRDICLDSFWYNEKYKILADYEFTVRVFKEGKKFMHIPVIVDCYEGNGISETKQGNVIGCAEMKIIRKEYFHDRYRRYNFIIACTLVNVRRWLVKDTTPKWIRTFYRRFTNRINNINRRNVGI